MFGWSEGESDLHSLHVELEKEQDRCSRLSGEVARLTADLERARAEYMTAFADGHSKGFNSAKMEAEALAAFVNSVQHERTEDDARHRPRRGDTRSSLVEVLTVVRAADWAVEVTRDEPGFNPYSGFPSKDKVMSVDAWAALTYTGTTWAPFKEEP